MVKQTLLDAALAPNNLHAIVTSMPDADFATDLHRAANLAPRSERHRQPTRGAYGSTADLLIALGALEPFVPARGAVLAWTCGNNGEFACCILRRT